MNHPIFTGTQGPNHIQGIAVDEKGYLYYSFTTKLIKAAPDGTPIATVDGLLGHLGCIAYHGGKIYGSLEFKNDKIGRGILKSLGKEQELEDNFYIAVFDCENFGDPTLIPLPEVLADYKAGRYGCSGIDGVTLAPLPGQSGKKYLFVAYGIYGDVERQDNDHQVLLCLDPDDFSRQGKYFVHTGNTTYGVQNLEYDSYTNRVYMAVYKGKKPQFPNFPLYCVDWTKPAVKACLEGLNEEGLLLQVEKGWKFPYGATGLYSYGNGEFLISEEHCCQSGQCSFLHLYVADEKYGFVLKM